MIIATSYILQKNRNACPFQITTEPNKRLSSTMTTHFVRKNGIQSIKFKMWVELSSNFCHLSDIIRAPLITNSLYEKTAVVFSPHTPCGGVRLALFTPGDHAYGVSRKRPKTTVLHSRIRVPDMHIPERNLCAHNKIESDLRSMPTRLSCLSK